MQVAKRFFGVAALVAVAALSSAQEAAAAAQMLSRSMQREFPTNVVAIILQRDPRAEGAFQRVKVERSKSGMARCTILQPLRMAGIVSVDNGDRLLTYVPDDKVIIDQDSPGKMPCEVDDRMALARKNYSFRFAGSMKIAGREAVCVVANPKFSTLESRRYYLDRETAYPLRLETWAEGNEISIVFDTKDIQYPKGLDSRFPEIDVPGDLRRIRYSMPARVVSDAQAKSKVGFSPLVPSGLPLGFKVQEIQFNDSKEWKSIVVRLSDGLARATVYQWRPDETDATIKTVENSTVDTYTDSKGNLIKVMLVSDLGASVRKKLLEAFVAQSLNDPAFRAQKLYGLLNPMTMGLQASLELVSSVWAFAGIECLNGVDSSIPATGLLPLTSNR